jgi:hypothetical protein
MTRSPMTQEVSTIQYVIEAADLDAATAWAAKMPAADYGSVEIRPMVGLEGLAAEGLGAS